MKKLYFFSILAAILAISDCGGLVDDPSIDDIETPIDNTEARTWRVSIDAGPAVETRAISVGGNNGQTLYFNWDNGDAVEVVKAGATVGSLSANQSAGNSAFAVLEGTLTGTYSVGDDVTLYYHTAALDYTGQDGTLASVSTSKSYLQATSTVKSVDASGGFLAMSDAAFTPMQSYLDLSFVTTDGDPIPIATLGIWAEGGKLVKTRALDGTTVYATEASPLIITPADATGKLFLAVRDENGGANNYHFKAISPDQTFTYVGSKNLQYGHFYAGNVAMTLLGVEEMPFTIEATDGPLSLRFFDSVDNGFNASIEFSTDGVYWTPYSNSANADEIMFSLSKAGQKLMLRGDNASYEGCSIKISGNCYIYGNMMSLIDHDDYSTLTELTANNTFQGLLQANSSLYNHPSIPLLLPATKLSESCYNLMFANCPNLTTAPVLPATELANKCYAGMFIGCSNLTSVTCLATSISSSLSLGDWLLEVSSTGTIFINPSLTFDAPLTYPTTLPSPWSWGRYGIPEGWTVQKYVP